MCGTKSDQIILWRRRLEAQMVSSRRRRARHRRRRGPVPLTLPANVDVEGFLNNIMAQAHQEQANDFELGSDSESSYLEDVSGLPLGDARGQSLIGAASLGLLEEVEDLLLAGADPNYISTTSGWTALNYAATNAHLDVVRALVATGANVEHRAIMDAANQRLTPLQMAVVSDTSSHEISGHRRKIVEALLAGGADPNARYGDTTTSRPDRLIAFALTYGNTRGCVLALLRGGAAIPSHLPCILFDVSDNRDAFALVEKVKKAGDFRRYARAHQRRYVSILEKCFGEGAIPRDVLPAIALFLAPYGGS